MYMRAFDVLTIEPGDDDWICICAFVPCMSLLIRTRMGRMRHVVHVSHSNDQSSLLLLLLSSSSSPASLSCVFCGSRRFGRHIRASITVTYSYTICTVTGRTCPSHMAECRWGTRTSAHQFVNNRLWARMCASECDYAINAYEYAQSYDWFGVSVERSFSMECSEILCLILGIIW